MSNTNDFVPFCNENTGTNLPTQSAYLANPNLPIGNQPGIASSSFNNKAVRQATTIGGALAQVVSDQLAVDMLDNQNSADHAIPTAIKLAISATMRRLSPVQTLYSSSSGNHQLTYKIFIATPTISPTAGATYSDGTTTFTVSDNYNGVDLHVKGATTPATTSGTLTKSGGTGDATLTYYAYRVPIYMDVEIVGGGGGGGGVASGAAAAAAAGGGGAGGYSFKRYVAPTGVYAYVIGAAGAAASSGSNPGGNGGDTTFDVMTGHGGNGGGGSGTSGSPAPAGQGGTGGTGTGGDINLTGGGGGYGLITSGATAAAGYGGNNLLSSSVHGAINTTAVGTAGFNYGGGGSGSIEISNGGAQVGVVGAAGAVIVREYYQ